MKKVTSALKFEGPFANENSTDDNFCTNVLNFHAIFVFDIVRVQAEATTFVEAHRYLGLNGAILLVASTYKVVC